MTERPVLAEGVLPVHPIDARDLALQLLRRHALAGWRFRFDHARRRFGSCRYGQKLITLSRPLTLLNDADEVRDTILHEIAHALTPGDGHGRKWKAACLRIGAKPERCYKENAVVAPPRKPAPYRFGCSGCDWWVDRRRRTAAKFICRTCRKPLVYQERNRVTPAPAPAPAAPLERVKEHVHASTAIAARAPLTSSVSGRGMA